MKLLIGYRMMNLKDITTTALPSREKVDNIEKRLERKSVLLAFSI